MPEHVLPVAGAVAHTAEELYKLMVQTVYACFKYRLLACLANLIIDLFPRLFNDFLNPRRMNASVKDELFKSEPCDLAAHGIEA